jgi:hypothetical protein
MTGSRAAIGLSLLCALVFCALAAPAAMAVPSGTAFYTCVKDVGNGTFEDEHCTKEKANGDFKHVLIPAGTTEVTVNNNSTGLGVTNSVLVGEAGGSKFELEATGFMAKNAWIENTKVGEADIGVGGGEGTFTGVKVKNLPKCGIVDLNTKTLEEVDLFNTVAETKNMEVDFRPKVGTVFAEMEFIQIAPTCALKGIKIKVEGTATGVPNGATLEFTKASTEASKAVCEGKEKGSGLCVAKKPAFFTGTFTAKMGKEGGEDGNPITLTTTS